MTLSEEQLKAWSNQGATVTAENTHNSIRAALAAYRWPDGVSYDSYLQGSYRNFTNIRGDSDVDLVVELTSVHYSNLTEEEKSTLRLLPATYNFFQFREDAIRALTSYYGSEYIDTSGKKSIKVLPASGRLKVDVVPCVTYYYYSNLKLVAQGMTFWTVPGWQQIINYPKLHFKNGADKNSDQCTRSWYRPTIRMFKNARNRIIESKPQLTGRFPSYFIEGLLYNVPDNKYGTSFQDTYVNTVNWLNEIFNNNSAGDFTCQNGMHYLFGSASVQWNKADAREYVSQVIDLWNN